jgi:hypothetical protein
MKTKEEMEAFLTPPRLEWIHRSIRDGLADYEDPTLYSAKARVAHTPSVSSMIRNCHIVHRANMADLEELQVKVLIRRGRVLFRIADQVDVWFKKLDRNLRPRFVPTEQARAFVEQRMPMWPEEELPPVITNTVAGYLPDAAEQEVRAYITAPFGNGNAWVIRLPGAVVIDMFATETQLSMEDMPARQPVDNNPKRIQIRPGVLKKDAENHSRD